VKETLIGALEAERDAALQEASFQRERAERATSRIADMRDEADGLRRRVRALIESEQRLTSRAEAAEAALARRRDGPGEAERTEQLRIALDSARRLQRERDRLRVRFTQVEAQRDAIEQESCRLQARVSALEGAQRIAGRT